MKVRRSHNNLNQQWNLFKNLDLSWLMRFSLRQTAVLMTNRLKHIQLCSRGICMAVSILDLVCLTVQNVRNVAFIESEAASDA